MSSEKLLRLLLYMISIHSIFVGLALISTPGDMFAYFGYQPVSERFFTLQGGVFHIIMGIAYYLAAKSINKDHSLILLAIITKISATLFLFSYFLFIQKIWMVLVSGIVDALMAMVVIIVFHQFKKDKDLNL
jgi:CHASE2 domain-containing sensor protein